MFLINRTPALTPPPPPTPAPIGWTAARFEDLLRLARHSRGSAATARVTLVEFGDFECPSCRRAFNSYLVKAEKLLPIRLVFFHFPLVQHHEAMPAAVATEAADLQGKFWPMYDALYTGADRKLTSDMVEAAVRTVGLDLTRYAKDCADPALSKKVQDDLQLGNSVHVFQTPTFIVRDEKTGSIYQGVGGGGVDAIVSRITGTPLIILPSGTAEK